ncbi:hypothetical protein K466DRAFT_578982 [Polyporus arcularius HHB13444]|uniref:Aspartic peptidase DDI1-type domain-containing protein n=1 Tax=Polyporus arcularius HHB13444 TaxID=1314778 RepID=A0A5C3NTX9_9APHY|nr:hypothetical protein K466DRAFT_578982 [Polyporus arcularius HHB13444]
MECVTAPRKHTADVHRKAMTPVTVQPYRDPQLHSTLCALVNINGTDAYTLFDTGSTTNSITLEFAHISRAPKIVLEEQVILQLGCSGSRSKINYGTRVPVKVGPVSELVYFDIYGVVLDMHNRQIVVNGTMIPAFTVEEDKAFRKDRKTDKRSPEPFKASQ